MMGDGAVVTPEDSVVRAPEDGEVCFVFETKHAIGFLTDSGVSLLIHMGIDTVALNGEGFEVFVKNGQKVKKGRATPRLESIISKKMLHHSLHQSSVQNWKTTRRFAS